MKQTRRDLEKVYARFNDISVPDANFNATKAKAIIAKTIEDATKFHNSVPDIDNGLKERVDVVSSYGCYRFNRGFKPIEKYLGRKYYEQLIGEELLEKVRVMDTVNKLNGNDKFKDFVLL